MGCFNINAGINAKCDTSMGGIVEVYIANASEWHYVDGAGENTLRVEALSGDPQPYFYRFTFRKGTSQMTSTLNIDDANGTNYVSTELQMTFGRMESKKRLAIVGLAQGDLIVIVKDCNGLYWCLGETEGVTASAGEGATGQARGDSNHYSITLVDNNVEFPKEMLAKDFEDDVVIKDEV